MGSSNKITLILAAVVLCITPLYANFCPNTKHNATYDGTIIGGVSVDIGCVPWQVYIVLESLSPTICGGSIISTTVVVTSAHCIENYLPKHLYVVAGNTRLDQEYDAVEVRRTAVHPLYTSEPLNYDIALIELLEQLEFGPSISSIKLAKQDEELLEPQAVQVTGWGSSAEWGPPTNHLQKIYILVINQEVCKNIYADIQEVTDNMFCAAYPNGRKGACEGDEGGPVVANGVLVGVVSWSEGCAHSACPDVYTRIASIRDWIDEESATMTRN